MKGWHKDWRDIAQAWGYSLHSLSCHRDSEGELVCSCVPIIWPESPASERATEYDDSTTVRWDHIESAAARRSCSPRTPGRSAITEVRP